MSAEPAPTVDGVAPGEVAAIEEGCGESGFPDLTLTLKQVITDGAGRLTLLEDNGSGPDSVARMMVLCMLDTRASPARRWSRAPGVAKGDLHAGC